MPCLSAVLFVLVGAIFGTSEEDWEARARSALQSQGSAEGLDVGTWILDRIWPLALEGIGTSDKVAITFHQEIEGLEVFRTKASVLFDRSGRLLAVRERGLAGMNVETPQIHQADARRLATTALGFIAEDVQPPRPVLYPLERRLGRLAWHFELRSLQDHGVPPQEEILIDATTGDVLFRASSVHMVDLLGRVEGWATPGRDPDLASNPPVTVAVANAPMSATIGSTLTDQEGNWVLPYDGTDVQAVRVDFGASSPFVLVEDDSGAGISLTRDVTPGVPELFTLNDPPSEFDTAEMNAQRHVIGFREYIRAISPGDTTFDFQVLARVNVDLTCGAYFNGSSINFFRAQGPCANAAYSTVISHEQGHWAVNLYQGGASGPFHEGVADVWAMYIHDTPFIGENFCGSGCFVRDGNNSRQKCGSGCDETCHGGSPQTEGEVLMGAFWKLRNRLNAAFGDAQGDLIADTLFLSWLQAFDDDRICDDIYTNLLFLDDDDGDPSNGTPHGAFIEAAFEDDHGWPDLHNEGGDPDCPAPCERPHPYGTGTHGSGFFIPQISAPGGCAFLGNAAFSVMVDKALGGAAGAFFLGLAPAELDLGGWTLLVALDGFRLLFPFATSGQGPGDGAALLGLGLPDDSLLDGLELYLQAVVLDPAAPSGVAATSGIAIQVCDPG